MCDYATSISSHYGSLDLIASITAAAKSAGMSLRELTRDHLRALDEFHTRGRRATQLMGEQLGLIDGMTVLDIGCGIGGPARTLAAEFGCLVTGIDIVKSYCATAAWLTNFLGLNRTVRFVAGNAADLPFVDESYDVVLSQHVLMNIPNKASLVREIHRVLRRRGQYAFFEVCTEASQQPYFPVPWANHANIHFPISADEFRRILADRFCVIQWQDVTEESLLWFRKTIAVRQARSAESEPVLGLHLVMGPTAAAKMSNMVRNLEQGRIRMVQGAVERKD